MANFLNLFYTVSSAVAMVSSLTNLKRIYLTWDEKSEDPSKTRSEKAEMVFEGLLQTVICVSNAGNIYSIAKEVVYRGQTQKLEKIYEQWKTKAEQTKNFGACGDEGGETLENLRQLHSNMQQNLLSYQRANLILGCTNTVFLLKDVMKQISMHPLQNEGRAAVICKTILKKGCSIYISYKKSNCNEKLEFDNNESINLILKTFDLTASLLNFKSLDSKLLNDSEGTLEIHHKLYLPYVLPDSLQDETLNYLPISENLKQNEFFKSHVCPITKEPIARPIFIIADQILPQMYERSALVKYVFQSGKQSFRDPLTGVMMTPKNIYECPALTEKFCEIFLKLVTLQSQSKGGSHVNT